MSSLSVKLPLAYDDRDGYQMIRSMRTLVKQNLKMLLLTIPGERIMVPSFGVGIKQYLFENFDSSVSARIRSNINSQARTFMPYISIDTISFGGSDLDLNRMQIAIRYAIPSLKIEDLLTFTI